jgi:hypothetical protein
MLELLIQINSLNHLDLKIVEHLDSLCPILLREIIFISVSEYNILYSKVLFHNSHLLFFLIHLLLPKNKLKIINMFIEKIISTNKLIVAN